MNATPHEQMMNAVFLCGPNDVRLEEATRPAIERPDDVLIAVAYTGICGTELHAIAGYRFDHRAGAERPTHSP
jgi:threonine dehydrogenase-like Zn-dependent dehydrogenase